MKPILHAGLHFAACAIATAAPVTLIDPLAPLRNGGFEEDPAAQTLTAAPWWDSYFAEGDSAIALAGDTPRTGTRHALVTGYQGAGNRVHPSQTIAAATWTIAEGDIFTIRFYAKAASGFDAGSDLAQVIFHVVNSAGNLVSDAVAGEFAADRQMSRDFAIPAGGNWQECSAVSKPVRAGSPWIGQRLKMRILHTGDRNESMALDDVTLTASRAEVEGSATLLAGYAMEGNLNDDSGQARQRGGGLWSGLRARHRACRSGVVCGPSALRCDGQFFDRLLVEDQRSGRHWHHAALGRRFRIGGWERLRRECARSFACFRRGQPQPAIAARRG